MITIYGLSSKALDRIRETIPNIVTTYRSDTALTFFVELNTNTILKFYNNEKNINLDLGGKIATIEHHEFDKISLF